MTTLGQAWFPKNWSEKDIKHAGEHVVGLRKNRRVADGKPIFGVYKGVRVYLSEKKFRECIANYIETYNKKRPHESLNYDTPMHYEQQLLKQDCPNTHPKV
ncbi:MAG: integrase core domain-containing protein [Clostridia bacterium]|nr:integrase core domain-containing protein [Clostridia bacterium]